MATNPWEIVAEVPVSNDPWQVVSEVPAAAANTPSTSAIAQMPMADWVGNISDANLTPQMPTAAGWGRIGASTLPPLGATLGMLAGIPGGPLLMGAGGGLGAMIGETGRQALTQNTGLEPSAPFRENIGNMVQQGIFGAGSALIPGGPGFVRPALGGALTMGGAEAAKQGITGEYDLGKIGTSSTMGLGIGLGGGLLGKMGDMFFGDAAPIAEKAGSQFVDWAKKNNLPFSVDALSNKPSLAMTQAAADYGPGMIITNWQRGKLIKKTTELAKAVNGELGLTPSVGINNAADEIAAATKNLINKKMTHAEWNTQLRALPDDIRIDAQNLLDTVEKIGGLSEIERIYQGSSGHVSREAENIKRVILRDGQYDKADLEYLINSVNRKYTELGKQKDWTGQKNTGLLKGAIVEDISYTQLPELNTTLGAVRTAADNAFSENIGLINQFPILGKLVSKNPNKTGLVLNLFNEGNIPAATALREKLMQTPGGQNAWEALQATYLERVFDSTLVNRADFGRKVFDPGKYLDWYEKYGNAASQIMPEVAPALQEWSQIAQGISKDFERRVSPMEALKTGFKSLGITGGGGYLAGGGIGATVLPGFSTLAALGTMGPGNWGFIRNSLTKQAAAPISMGSRLLSIPPQMEAMEAAK